MPICELYHFQIEGGEEYFYTSAATDIEHDGETWLAIPITRGRGEENPVGQIEQSTLRVEIDHLGAAVMSHWSGEPPDREVTLKILTASTEDIAGTMLQQFSGVVADLSREGKIGTFSAVPRMADGAKKGPAGAYSSLCRWRLYGPGCQLDESVLRQSLSVQSADEARREITIETATGAIEPDLALGGFVTFSGEDRRALSQSVEEVGGVDRHKIRLSGWISGLGEGSTISLTPGCNHSIGQCADRFSNIENFGGFPTLASVKSTPYQMSWRADS